MLARQELLIAMRELLLIDVVFGREDELILLAPLLLLDLGSGITVIVHQHRIYCVIGG
jgi:hypothetical protein